MRKLNYYLLSAILCLGLAVQAQTKVSAKYEKDITVEQLQKHLNFLAGEKCQGRGTGQEGQKIAAQYIAQVISSYGVQPILETNFTEKVAGDWVLSNGLDGYFYKVPLVNSTIENAEISVKNQGFTFLEDFYCSRSSSAIELNAKEVVFLGYGIDAVKYSDLKNMDLAGKVVVLYEGEPIKKNGKSHISGSEKPSGYANTNNKIKTLKTDYKPAAIIIASANTERTLTSFANMFAKPQMVLANGSDLVNTPVFYVKPNVAASILGMSQNEIKSKFAKINAKGKSQSVVIKRDVFLNIIKTNDPVEAYNIAALVPGTELPDEYVVISAHYDHLGDHDGEIYYGADDNGSGSASLLNMLAAFKKMSDEGYGPKRSLLFVWMTGEESGLLGSEYYVNYPIFPLQNTVCNLNIDMIGRHDKQHNDGSDPYVYVIGSDKLSSDLHKLNEKAALGSSVKLDYTFNDENDPNRFYYRSDHYNFAKKGIPVIFYFSGVHDDYHKPTDVVEKIEFEKMAEIVKLVYRTAYEVANAPERIRVDSNKK